MTSYERIARMFAHKEADRVPIVDSPWDGTIARWKREGMPQDADWRDFFGADKVASVFADISPRYPRKILEDKPEYLIATTEWGVTVKLFKHQDSTPEFLDFTMTTPERWLEAKSRMTPDSSRVITENLKKDYPRWRAEGQWVEAYLWFGFDVTHSWSVGTETLLMAMLEEPEWVSDMFNTYLDLCIRHFDMLWDAGYPFDSITWPDDMGYKGSTFFSPDIYRRLVKPVHARCAAWAHKKGIPARLHSCGYIMPLLEDIIEAGIDALNPIEVKAGMDPIAIKKQYGDKLLLHGGVNAVLWDDTERIIEEVKRVLPALADKGGYIFGTDHSVPNSVSLDAFRRVVACVKEYGKY